MGCEDGGSNMSPFGAEYIYIYIGVDFMLYGGGGDKKVVKR